MVFLGGYFSDIFQGLWREFIKELFLCFSKYGVNKLWGNVVHRENDEGSFFDIFLWQL